VDDTSDQAVSTYGYIYINAAGKIELDDVEADESDTSGNTSGILRYNDTGTDTTDRRMIGWFFMNSTGSGELFDYEVGNLKDGDIANAVTRTDSTNDTIDDTVYGTDLTNTTIHFYSSGRGIVEINCLIKFSNVNTAGREVRARINDGAGIATSEASIIVHATGGNFSITPVHSEVYAQGTTTFFVASVVNAGNATVADKTISITEN